MKLNVLVIGGVIIIIIFLTTRYYSQYKDVEMLQSDLKIEQKELQDTKKALEQANEKLRQADQRSFQKTGEDTEKLKTDCSAWLKSCESSCTQTSDSPIPKHVHFISISRPFSFHEWLAVMSARKKIKPDKITVYTDGQQDSCWWRRALPYIQHQLIHVLPGSIVVNGVSIKKSAHIADYLRVSILYHEGGIYMDTDSVTLNSFDPLLSNQVVLATDCNNCVANGVMMAQKHSCFICKYAHRSCQKFDGGWTTHSVNTMNAFVKEVDTKKEGLLVLPARGGFYPMCWTPEGFHQLYSEDFDKILHYKKSEIYAVHLFANRGEATTFPKTVNNIDWIHTNKSLVAIAIRESLPSEFSEHHLNTGECASLPFDD